MIFAAAPALVGGCPLTQRRQILQTEEDVQIPPLLHSDPILPDHLPFEPSFLTRDLLVNLIS
jgi:hypothetical protein